MTSLERKSMWATRLAKASEELRCTGKSLVTVPVVVEELIAEFELGDIKIEPGKANQHGALRQFGGRWHPVIYRNPDRLSGPLSPRERFTVLHELAHALIDASSQAVATRKREYWELEGICSQFAGEVLVPSGNPKVASLFDSVKDPRSMTSVLKSVSKLCDASTPVVAKRLVEYRRQGIALGLKEITNRKERQTHLRVMWHANGEQRNLRDMKYLEPNDEIAAAIMELGHFEDRVGVVTIQDGNALCSRVGNMHWLVAIWGLPLGESEDGRETMPLPKVGGTDKLASCT